MNIKEKIVITLIILITIILSGLPFIIDLFDSSPEIEDVESSSLITITINGEINTSEEAAGALILRLPIGTSYGEIIGRIRVYLTKYSIIDGKLNRLYYSDSEITIESRGKDVSTKPNLENGKINLNEASFDELITINHIKKIRANKIIEYRQNKRIESYLELKNLLRISDEQLEEIKSEAFL